MALPQAFVRFCSFKKKLQVNRGFSLIMLLFYCKKSQIKNWKDKILCFLQYWLDIGKEWYSLQKEDVKIPIVIFNVYANVSFLCKG